MATLLPNAEVTSSELRGYRIFIFSQDHPHPPHVHVGKGKRFSSWNLTSVWCADPDGFSSQELRVQRTIISENIEAIWRTWNDYWQRQQGTR